MRNPKTLLCWVCHTIGFEVGKRFTIKNLTHETGQVEVGTEKLGKDVDDKKKKGV